VPLLDLSAQEQVEVFTEAVDTLANAGYSDIAITIANIGVGAGLTSHTNNPYVAIPGDFAINLFNKIKEIAVRVNTPATEDLLRILRQEPDEWQIVAERLAQSDLERVIETIEIEIEFCWGEEMTSLMAGKLEELRQRQNVPKPALT
jgi:hypothetical protein